MTREFKARRSGRSRTYRRQGKGRGVRRFDYCALYRFLCALCGQKVLISPPIELNLKSQRTQRGSENLPLQDLSQRILQVRMLELISGGRELGWFHALTTKKKLFAHLSEDQADGEGGQGENRQAVQDRSQNAGELRIGHWNRSDSVDRS